MPLSPWVRTTLWRSDHWPSALTRMAEALRAAPVTETTFARAFELGNAFELVEPDPTRALAMFLVASRGGLVEAVPRARRLAHEARAHNVVAELALTEFRTTRDPAQLVEAGVAWIHGGQPDRAVEPLAMAVAQRPSDPQPQALLAAARRAVRDPHGEVSRWIERAARSSADLQPAMYLQAARLARALELEELYAGVLQTAADLKLGGELATLLEDRLLARGEADPLLAFYRRSLESVDDHAAWVEVVCTAGLKLVLRARQVGMGLRLLRSGLERAYRHGVPETRGHLAAWELLLAHARETRATVELMPLVVLALGRPLADDERLYLSRIGFDISWQGARDVDAARPYASVIAELVPDHPSVHAFMAAELPSLLGGSTEDDAMLRALANLSDADELVSLDLGARGQTELPPGRASGPLLPPRATEAPPTQAPAIASAPSARPAVQTTLPRTASPSMAPPAPVKPPASRLDELDIDISEDLPTFDADDDEVDVDMDMSDDGPASRAKPPIPPAALAAIRGGRPIRVPATPPLRDGAATRAARAVVPIDLAFRVGTEPPMSAVARDISASGLYLVTSASLPPREVLILDLRLPGTSMLSVATFRVSAQVMRRDATGYGLMFVDPSPELVRTIAAVTASSAE